MLVRTFKSWAPVAVIGALLVVVSGAGVAVAANGHPALLGQVNRESAATVIRNHGKGAALTLHTAARTTPNLVVSNHAKIARLNADFLDGLSSARFARARALTNAKSRITALEAQVASLQSDVSALQAKAAQAEKVELFLSQTFTPGVTFSTSLGSGSATYTANGHNAMPGSTVISAGGGTATVDDDGSFTVSAGTLACGAAPSVSGTDLAGNPFTITGTAAC